jgi:pyruvate kinase
MLSGETSVGKFPVGTVHVMSHIAAKTEAYLADQPAQRESILLIKTMQVPVAAAKGVWQIVRDLKVKLVVVWSQTGGTARIFSKCRFNVPIVALSSDQRALRRMALHYGVIPQEMIPPEDFSTLLLKAEQLVVGKGFAANGDRIVLVAGGSVGAAKSTSGVIIHTLGEQWQTPAIDPSGAAMRFDVGKEG